MALHAALNAIDTASGDQHSQSADTVYVLPIPPREEDRWPLTCPYVETVWSEFLAPTATLLGRRLGELIASHRHGTALSLTAMGASLGVPPNKVRYSLARLSRYEIIEFDQARHIVGVSGLAPDVGPARLRRLSPGGRRRHELRAVKQELPRIRAESAASTRALGVRPRRRPPGRSL